MLDTSTLASPEALALAKRIEDARKVYDAAQANLDNPEELFIVASAAWDNGMGNSELSDLVSKWVEAKDSHLSSHGWHTDPQDYELALPAVTLSLGCEDTEEDIAKLAEVLLQLNAIFREAMPDYVFNIMENSCAYNGSYTLDIESEDDAEVLRNRYSERYDNKDVSLVETLTHIRKTLPYCSCGKHSSSEDESYGW